jgi:hypothetical protein
LSKSLKVYLDSSDFSVLSDVKKGALENAAITDQLCRWSDSGEVQFLFSGVHITEMAPLSTADSKAAEARADLLERLCRRNAVLSSDKIIHTELQCLRNSLTTDFNAFSAVGNWFPDPGDVIEQIGMPEVIEKAIADLGLNRQQRRDIAQTLKKKFHKKKMKDDLLSKIQEDGLLNTLMARYPMRQEDAQIVVRYFFDNATKEEANEAFLESLRRPGTFIRWFEKNRETFHPFLHSLRRPAQEMLKIIEDTAQAFQEIRNKSSAHGDTALATSWWKKKQDEILCNSVMNAMLGAFPDYEGDVSASKIDRYCPGMSTCLRTIHSTIRDSLLECKPRQPTASDYVDGLHAVYAPYADVFRADSYMASHVRSNVEKFGTIVVSKLPKLTQVIQGRLDKQT